MSLLFLHWKEIKPSFLYLVDFHFKPDHYSNILLYYLTVCAAGLPTGPTSEKRWIKGFNYSWDVPSIAYCCKSSFFTYLQHKEASFPRWEGGGRGMWRRAVQGSLCWLGFVWEHTLDEWQPGLKISSSFCELSFPSKLLHCCNFRSQLFPLTVNVAIFWARMRWCECQARFTGNLLLIYRALKGDHYLQATLLWSTGTLKNSYWHYQWVCLY